MAHLSFFKQVRNDGGVRYGILLDGTSLWMHFAAGSGIDPGLLWYVDVELVGASLNGEPEAARTLFIEYTQQVEQALEEVIQALRSETGIVVWPVSSREIEVADGVALKVTCSAIRKMQTRELAQALTELQADWRQHINSLEVSHQKRRPSLQK
jgi:hypothetical protein